MGKVNDIKVEKGMDVRDSHSFHLVEKYSNSEKDETSASNPLPRGPMASCF